ncbi:MAG: sensor histidine kinase, partial [Thermocrispum sp.]
MAERQVGLAETRAGGGDSRQSSMRGGRFASQLAPPIADGIVVAFLTFLWLLAVLRVIYRSTSTSDAVVGCAYLAALVALQLWWFGGPKRDRSLAGTVAVLLAQAALVFLPFVHFYWWLGLPGILAGSLLLSLPARAGIPLFSAVVLSVGPLRLPDPEWGASSLVFGIVTTLMTGVAVYGLTRLAYLVHELHAARDDLARLAVAEERLRFARDLQDRLGIRLSEIVARTERIRRKAADGGPAQVHDDLAEVLQVSRRALADVRSVASGYRRLSLDAELAIARSVLEAAGVAVRVERQVVGELAEPVATVLAVVLREAVTNVLRQGRVEGCQIRLGRAGERVLLEIVTDRVAGGEDSQDESDTPPGLAARVRDLGGQLSAGVGGDGRYVVRATIPQGELPEPEPAARRLPTMSRRLANSVVTVVMLCFGAIILADVLMNQRDGEQAAIGVGYLAVVLGLQVGYFARPIAQERWLSVGALLVQGVLVYLPVAQYGGFWLTLLGFVAANALLVLRPAVAIPVAVGVLGGIGWIYSTFDPSPVRIAGEVVWACATVAAVYGITRLAMLVAELNAAQGELARMAVAEERLRFARDVHDVLGLSLSAVTLKAELANRLLGIRPEAAAEQLAEIVSLSRAAIGEVRSTIGGYQQLRLEEELRLARSVLSSAEIDVEITGEDVGVPEQLDG